MRHSLHTMPRPGTGTAAWHRSGASVLRRVLYGRRAGLAHAGALEICPEVSVSATLFAVIQLKTELNKGVVNGIPYISGATTISSVRTKLVCVLCWAVCMIRGSYKGVFAISSFLVEDSDSYTLLQAARDKKLRVPPCLQMHGPSHPLSCRQ